MYKTKTKLKPRTGFVFQVRLALTPALPPQAVSVPEDLLHEVQAFCMHPSPLPCPAPSGGQRA